jgi:hypothetical protein
MGSAPPNYPNTVARFKLMNRKQLLRLLIGMALSACVAYAQGARPGAIKKPRKVEDYKSGTLKEIVGDDDPNREALVPFSVRVIYSASVRAISSASNEALNDWARCCAGNPDHYKGYVREMRFVEDGATYWLAVEEELIADFQKDLEIGDAVELFLIRLSPREANGKRGSVLLIERFQKAGTNSDQVNQALDWIASNLSSYSEKDMKVEVPGRCELKITDLVNSASVSKAVLFLPLSDLDISKVSVQPQQDNDTWGLWLHSTSGKNSIRFMLYQGNPAEGGHASKHSLTFRNPEKAEAMAEGFRRAINLCNAAKAPTN